MHRRLDGDTCEVVHAGQDSKRAALPITEIAFATGWNSLGTFGRTFRDITGLSPGELRLGERSAARRPEQVPNCFLSAAYRPDLTIAVSEKRRREGLGRVMDPTEMEVP